MKKLFAIFAFALLPEFASAEVVVNAPRQANNNLSCSLIGTPGVPREALDRVVATAQSNLSANRARITAEFNAAYQAPPGGHDNAAQLNDIVAKFNQGMRLALVRYQEDLSTQCAIVGCTVQCR